MKKIFLTSSLLISCATQAMTFTCFSKEQGNLGRPKNVKVKVAAERPYRSLSGATYTVRPVELFLKGKHVASFQSVGSASSSGIELTLLNDDMAMGTLVGVAEGESAVIEVRIRIARNDIQLDTDLSCASLAAR